MTGFILTNHVAIVQSMGLDALARSCSSSRGKEGGPPPGGLQGSGFCMQHTARGCKGDLESEGRPEQCMAPSSHFD